MKPLDFGDNDYIVFLILSDKHRNHMFARLEKYGYYVEGTYREHFDTITIHYENKRIWQTTEMTNGISVAKFHRYGSMQEFEEAFP